VGLARAIQLLMRRIFVFHRVHFSTVETTRAKSTTRNTTNGKTLITDHATNVIKKDPIVSINFTFSGAQYNQNQYASMLEGPANGPARSQVSCFRAISAARRKSFSSDSQVT
jgi:hypothetical protein